VNAPRPDGSGVDFSPLESIISRQDLDLIYKLASRAIRLAEDFVVETRRLRPGHGKETWDRSAQYALQKLFDAETHFQNGGLSLHMEKYSDLNITAEYAPHILRSKSSPISSADGILQICDRAVAVELDHGSRFSGWLAKLLKASRSNLSHNIDGVLYIYGTSKDQRLWFELDDLTNEFYSVLDWAARKPVGVMTLGQEQILQSDDCPPTWREELLDWFNA
jgi:hypothetical protein